MTDMELLCKIEDISKEELEKVAKKGEIQPNEWTNLDAVVSIMKNVKKVQKMISEMDGEYGHSSRSYDTQFTPRMDRGNRSYRIEGSYDGMSNERGRSRTTGRYMSRDYGRSTHSIKDRMVDSLERMYDEAPTEHEKVVLDEWIRKIESSN